MSAITPLATETLLIALLTLLLGFAAGYVLAAKRQNRQAEIDALRSAADSLRGELNSEKKQTELRDIQLNDAKTELAQVRDTAGREAVRAARLESEKKAVESQLEIQRNDIQQMQESFRKDFELLANRIFNEKTEKFNQQSRISLDQVLEPLRTKLKEFEEKVDNTHQSSLIQSTSLREEIKHLRETGQRMSKEAENLTKALKNDSKVQGNWGEFILENILGASGLTKDREYFIQQSFTNDDGRRLQPDVMVKLPDDKWVVVDSKVSLTAWERYVAAEDELERTAQLKAHHTSMRVHIRSLAEKKYHDLSEGRNLDFILMFIPIESAYLTALNTDPNLFNEAYERNIVMVCPSTLIASLKIIASTWKHEYQNRNAIEIAQRGKLLLEKFMNFVEDMEKIGQHIDRSGAAYTEAMKKLRDGRGSLMRQAQQLEELGIKSPKTLGDQIIES